MKKSIRYRLRPQLFAVAVALCALLALPAVAQEEEAVAPLASVEFSADAGAEINGKATPAEYVSIHVDGGEMRQVLNSFAMQANRNIVIGPEVTNDSVNIHLNNVQWENALDVILKPYGYGFRQVGDATVVGELSRLRALETVEPLQSRIYKLKYLDASDVDSIITGMLSPRGSHNVITAQGQKGWKDLGQKAQRRNYQGSGVSNEMRAREEEQVYSKTIVVTDVPSVLDRVAQTLADIDQIPRQILVEARFMEVNEDFLRDIGVELGGFFEIDGNPVGAADQFFSATPNAFNPKSADVTGKRGLLNTLLDTDPSDSNIALTETPGSLNLSTFGQVFANGKNWSVLISMLEENEDTKTLSAPKVLTLDNQEAAIVVGTRYPIISSTTTAGNSTTKSEQLEYYESIGIQLNVVPQICADGYIRMIVRPSVTEIIDEIGINGYPVIKTRDTETQILAADGETIVIGGLLDERETDGVFKVPFLGDIPFLGRLFRRDTTDNMTVDLLIFISATVVDADNYDLIIEKKEVAEPALIVVAEAPVTANEIEPVEEKSVEDIMAELNAE